VIQRTLSVLSGSRRCPKDRVFGAIAATSSSVHPVLFVSAFITSLALSVLVFIAQLWDRLAAASKYLGADRQGGLTHDMAFARENSRPECREGSIRRVGVVRGRQILPAL